MASSLAFWIENGKQKSGPVDPNSNSNSQPSIELHFNYWLLEAEKRNFCERMCYGLTLSKRKAKAGNLEYLDIGVKFTNLKALESFNIYLPFHISKEDYVSTLGETICKDIDLISTVFNRSVGKVEPSEELGCYNIELIQQGKDNSKLCFFTHLALAPSNDGVEIKKSDELYGTQIVFPGALFDGLPKNTPGYFRFRICLTSKNRGVISKINKAKDSWLTNHFDKSELVDFRLNEARILPTAIRRKVAKQQLIKKIHFFLIRDAYAEYKAAHSKYECRLLEEELWSKYLGYDEVSSRNNMLIYHWSEKANENASLDNFSAFARFVRRKVRNWQLLAFIFFVLITGIISGVCVNYIWLYWNGSVQSTPNILESYDTGYFSLDHYWVPERDPLLKLTENHPLDGG